VQPTGMTERTHRASVSRRMPRGDACGRCATGCRTLALGPESATNPPPGIASIAAFEPLLSNAPRPTVEAGSHSSIRERDRAHMAAPAMPYACLSSHFFPCAHEHRPVRSSG
jgi:hypothetical protein